MQMLMNVLIAVLIPRHLMCSHPGCSGSSCEPWVQFWVPQFKKTNEQTKKSQTIKLLESIQSRTTKVV